MIIISFAYTTAAVVARRKTVTRRAWSDEYAKRFKPDMLAQAWSASPHRGGKKVGVIRIQSVTKEPTSSIPDSDWEAEGFAYMEENEILLGPDMSCTKLWRAWRQDPDLQTYVIRFEVVSIEAGVTPEMFFQRAVVSEQVRRNA